MSWATPGASSTLRDLEDLEDFGVLLLLSPDVRVDLLLPLSDGRGDE